MTEAATRALVIRRVRKGFAGKVAIQVNVDGADPEKRGSVGFAFLNGPEEQPPKPDDAYVWMDAAAWERMREWMLAVRRGLKLDPPPAPPAITPFHPAPLWLRLLSLGRIEGIIRKQYRGPKPRR